MTLLEQAEKARVATKVEGYTESITNQVNVLKTFKSDLEALKIDMQSKPAIYTDDEIAEFDTILGNFETEVNSIFGA